MASDSTRTTPMSLECCSSSSGARGRISEERPSYVLRLGASSVQGGCSTRASRQSRPLTLHARAAMQPPIGPHWASPQRVLTRCGSAGVGSGGFAPTQVSGPNATQLRTIDSAIACHDGTFHLPGVKHCRGLSADFGHPAAKSALRQDPLQWRGTRSGLAATRGGIAGT